MKAKSRPSSAARRFSSQLLPAYCQRVMSSCFRRFSCQRASMTAQPSSAIASAACGSKRVWPSTITRR